MVPHIKVEDVLHEAGASDAVLRRCWRSGREEGRASGGSHTLPDDRVQEVIAKLAQSDLPNLWKPARGQFFHVDALPYLGSGKLDLRAMRDTALRLSVSEAQH